MNRLERRRTYRRAPSAEDSCATWEAVSSIPTACPTEVLVVLAKKEHGRTRSGQPITDELLEKLAGEAEEGFDVDEIIRRRGGR